MFDSVSLLSNEYVLEQEECVTAATVFATNI